MTVGPLTLTPLDLDILGQIYPGRKITIAGVDPRASVTRIARALRTHRGRIAARLRAWQESGMLVGYDVWPNPALFDLVGGSFNLRVADPHRKAELWKRLALVDGAVQGLEFLGPWISFLLVAPDYPTLDRRMELVAHLDGVAEVGERILWPRLEAPAALSPLDLRIVRALRQGPRASLSEVAARARISPRTMTNRYRALLDSRAVWFVPVYDFTRLGPPVVALNLVLDDPGDRAPVIRTLRARYPGLLEFDWVGARPPGSERLLGLILLADSAARVEEIERAAASAPGVVAAEASTFVRILSFPETVERLLADPTTPPRVGAARARPAKRRGSLAR